MPHGFCALAVNQYLVNLSYSHDYIIFICIYISFDVIFVRRCWTGCARRERTYWLNTLNTLPRPSPLLDFTNGSLKNFTLRPWWVDTFFLLFLCRNIFSGSFEEKGLEKRYGPAWKKLKIEKCNRKALWSLSKKVKN